MGTKNLEALSCNTCTRAGRRNVSKVADQYCSLIGIPGTSRCKTGIDFSQAPPLCVYPLPT